MTRRRWAAKDEEPTAKKFIDMLTSSFFEAYGDSHGKELFETEDRLKVWLSRNRKMWRNDAEFLEKRLGYYRKLVRKEGKGKNGQKNKNF